MLETTKPEVRRNVRTFGFARGTDGKTILSEGVRAEIRPVDARIAGDDLYCACLDPDTRFRQFCVAACGRPARSAASIA